MSKNNMIFTEGVQSQLPDGWEKELEELLMEREANINELERENALLWDVLEKLMQPRFANKIETIKKAEKMVQEKFGKCTGPIRRDR
jgi:hypothetical protein